jgi:hypothetical protein
MQKMRSVIRVTLSSTILTTQPLPPYSTSKGEIAKVGNRNGTYETILLRNEGDHCALGFP